MQLPRQNSSESKQSNSPIKNYTPNAKNHVVAKGQTLIQISRAYKIPLGMLSNINNISNPDNLREGTKLSLLNRENSTINRQKKEIFYKQGQNKWRTYGPLKVNWSSWKPMGGSYVAPTLNKKGKALYLAVNCSVKKINATGVNGTWKDWNPPLNKFEHELINDVCNSKKI